jgi:Amt family ammonium transporter
VLTEIDSGNTAWMMASAALVFLMVPALTLFYGGLARHKNITSILTPCLVAACLLTLQWVLFGYSLSFGPDHGGWIGTLAWTGLSGVGAEPNLEYTGTIPHQAFMIYQAMIAILPTALILGACSERMKLSAYYLFILLWTTLVYDPVAHWVWGVGGFLRSSGVLDFAGGTVVHVNAGMAAFVIALMLGKRQEPPSPDSPPPYLPFAMLGAAGLWFGWFGLNAGGALSAGGLATNAFVMTQVGAAAAGVTWAVLDGIIRKQPTLLGMATGVVAGLVAISPAAGFVTIWGALGTGIGAALVSYFVIAYLKAKFSYDDSFDVFGVHGAGGIWGTFATGLWATQAANPNGANGLFYGNPMLLAVQVKGTLATIIYSFLMSWVLLRLVDSLVGLRPSR